MFRDDPDRIFRKSSSGSGRFGIPKEGDGRRSEVKVFVERGGKGKVSDLRFRSEGKRGVYVGSQCYSDGGFSGSVGGDLYPVSECSTRILFTSHRLNPSVEGGV